MPVTPSLRSRASSERSEGSGSPDEEILRCAQDDSQGSGGGGPSDGQSALTTWITQHSKVVSTSQWQSTSASSSSGGFGGAGQLYEYTS